MTKTLIAAAALSLLSSLSFAAAPAVSSSRLSDIGADVQSFMSTKTRAQVQSELVASQARMDYVHMGDESVPRDMFMSTRSPADVKAEAARGRIAVSTFTYEGRNN